MKVDDKSDLQRYYIIKKDLQLPVKVKLYFLIFENALDHTKAPRTIQSKKGFSKALLNAFTNLSSAQKGQYLFHNINFVAEQLNKQQKQKNRLDILMESDEIKNIQTSCEMLISTLKFNHWTSVSMKLDKNKKSIMITNKKKNFVLDMKNYFARKSNKYKHSLVFDAITEEINNDNKKFVFSFSQHIVSEIYDQVLKCVFNCQQQKILAIMMEQNNEDKDEEQSHVSHEKAYVFLSTKNINDYLSYKEKVEKQFQNNKFEFKVFFVKDKLRIEQSYKIEKVFRLQCVYNIDPKSLKQKFLYSLNFKNKNIAHSQVLQDFSKKYRAVYEKLKVNTRLYEYISIRQESVTNQEQILFVKGIENVMGKNYIEFLQVKVRTISPTQSKLIIHICIGLNSVITKDIVKLFLLEFDQMMFREDTQKMDITEKDYGRNEQIIEGEGECEDDEEDDDFQTVKGSEGSEEFVGFIQDDGEQLEKDGSIKIKRSFEFEAVQKIVESNSNINQYLKNRYSLVPEEHDDKLHRILQKHYLFGQWVRIKSGGVLCTDEEAIQTQKNLFKYALTKLGKNILKGELLKISLPVIIFRKQSHLHSIARNYSYAPLLFDKLAKGSNSLQRVKAATLLAISVGTLGISMLKPFNPILGETLQLKIDGCPIYLEQVSHHPPVGSYFFQGRKYRLHGQIQPRVSFGMNNIKGFSSRPNFLEFEDGNGNIQMIYGKMVIKGMLFGERQFNFEDKIYAYDKQNHIFSEIVYGPRKGKKKNDPLDFISGKIYKLKPQFLPKFNSSMPRIYPTKEYILEDLSSFEGIWNDEIRFDGKCYINFCQQLPYELTHEQFPLLSNSTFRVDIKRLEQNNIQQSQKQKQNLEQVQRRDRKLRQKFSQ